MRIEKVTHFIIIEDSNGDEVLIEPGYLDELITKLIAIRRSSHVPGPNEMEQKWAAWHGEEISA